MLPDIGLLTIFYFCVDERGLSWHALVHVCRKWRNLVFRSPRRLGLRLYYDTITPMRQALDVWPSLPIIIKSYDGKVMGNLIAALEYNDRICELDLEYLPTSQLNLKKTLEAMQRPFPSLTYLKIHRIHFAVEEVLPIPVPASFLGGFAPRLQTLDLEWIPFPGLPKLLLSATHLITLSLVEIPPSGYISPEALVACLSGLTRLNKLVLEFEYPESESPCLPPRTRTLLPALTELRLQAFSEYLEDLVARIDAPLLDNLIIIFLDEAMFDNPQTAQFIGRAPNFEAYDHAQVVFSDMGISVVFLQASIRLELRILGFEPDEQLSSLVQVCSSSFPRSLIASLERLYLLAFEPFQDRDPGDIDITQWLDLLRPFTGVKRLYMHPEFGPYIPLALQGLVGERVTDVLPALQGLFLEIREEEEREKEEEEEEDEDEDEDENEEGDEGEPLGVRDAIGQFVAARRLAGHPVYFYPWLDALSGPSAFY